jgi:hypothetical protein
MKKQLRIRDLKKKKENEKNKRRERRKARPRTHTQNTHSLTTPSCPRSAARCAGVVPVGAPLGPRFKGPPFTLAPSRRHVTTASVCPSCAALEVKIHTDAVKKKKK